ncbi:MAG: TetR/AcrR family transcriptional regulator [Proteobacteria bacterium]|nr:TetR/AcrR family transcriptional regulator [Pseudomonadota bacterium]
MAIAEHTKKIRPLPKGPGDAGWQAHKSSTTREQILDAAIRCIVDLGYANSTTTKIAEHAGLSRGATLHHFPSRLDIIRAAVDYIHQKRLRAFKKSVINTPKDSDHVSMAVHAYWSHINHPFFIVFFELSVAARHDDDLADILRPAQKAYDEEWYKTAQELYPEWQSDPEAFDLALNLSQQLLEGMAVSHLTHAREVNHDALLHYLEDSIRTLAP